MARLEVATTTAKRAMSAVQRLQARMQPSSNLRREAAEKEKSAAVDGATKAAELAVSEVGQRAAMLSDIVDMGEQAKRWEEETAAAAEVTKASVEGAGEDGDGDAETAPHEAEQTVVAVEMFARKAELSVAAAAATVDSWEGAVRRAAPA